MRPDDYRTCRRTCRGAIAGLALVSLTACGTLPPPGALPPAPPAAATPEQPPAPAPAPAPELSAATRAMYSAVQDGDITVPAVPDKYLSDAKRRQIVDYWSDEAPGTIIVDPHARYLYRVREGNKAMRYLVAVGAAGYGFSGEAKIPYQRDWPTWTPTQNMIGRNPEKYSQWANGKEGGLDNPLGARALYIHKNGKDTLYRIHGTSSPWTIGKATSSGCIRMFNQDVINLADKVDSGTKVIVLTKAQSGQGTRPPAAMAARRNVPAAPAANPDQPTGETT